MVTEQLNLIRSLERLNLALSFRRYPPVEPGANKTFFDFPAGTQIATLGFLVCRQIQKLVCFIRPLQLSLILHYLLAKDKGHRA